jgi:hypothetical protein
MTKEQIRKSFGHELMKSYQALGPDLQTLTPKKLAVLKAADAIYSKKDFEYFNIFDATSAFKRYPKLRDLLTVARNLVEKRVRRRKRRRGK